MQCPNCNALNPDDAAWCALCLAKFDPEPVADKSEPDLRVQPATQGMPMIQTDPPEVEEAWGAVARSESPIKAAGSELTWVCPSCTRQNSIKHNNCVVCGTSFFDAFKPPDAAKGPPKDPRVAVSLSFIPGAGHIYLGRVADGLTRLLLALWWWSFLIFVPSPTASLVGVRLMFLMASIGLVLVSMYDAHSAALDSRALPLLDRRLVMWSSLVLGAMVVVGGISSIMGATR